MTSYSYRKYRPGDEWEINRLYADITGRRRNNEAFSWQWLGAPGGEGEIWLIEADEEKEGRKLIGHHGVMPIRFSAGGNDILFGKTENTFVDPEFRSRILYPRFETRFRKEYEGRFHALFSTRGPKAAIRQRQAQGYELAAKWKTFSWGVRHMSDVVYLSSKLGRKMFPNLAKRFLFTFTASGKGRSTQGGVNVSWFNDNEARQSVFFKTFWPSIRRAYENTPSREYLDLKWRFWDNPYVSYMTLVLDSPTAGAGIAVLSNPAPRLFRIEDFVVEFPQSKAFGQLLETTRRWAASQGAYVLQFTTTDDSIRWIGEENFRLKGKGLLSSAVANRLGRVPVHMMPRKICEKGGEMGIKMRGWYITRLVSQGVT